MSKLKIILTILIILAIGGYARDWYNDKTEKYLANKTVTTISLKSVPTSTTILNVVALTPKGVNAILDPKGRDIKKPVVSKTNFVTKYKPICVETKTVTINKLNVTTRFINVSVYQNSTKQQYKSLINLKAVKCPTGSCGTGYYMCKEDVLSILNLPHSKFREGSSSNFYEFKQNQTQQNAVAAIPIKKDYAGEYVRLPVTQWYLKNAVYPGAIMVKKNVLDRIMADFTKRNISFADYGDLFNVKPINNTFYEFRRTGG